MRVAAFIVLLATFIATLARRAALLLRQVGCAATVLVLHRPAQQFFAFAHQAEIDLPAIEIDAADLHPNPGAYRITHAAALAAQFLPRLVKTEILAAEFGDMHQSLDVHRVQRDENTKAGGRGDHAAKLLAQMLAHVFAFKPGLDIAAGLVGAPLVGAAMQAGGLPRQLVNTGFFRLLRRVLDPRGEPLRQFRFSLTRRRQTG